jgi:UDP-galactopyranose mutase
MGLPDAARSRVVVIGGGLAGLAAAARLAKAGHSVELFEASSRLGGGWAPREQHGVLLDDAPTILGFPAPWRDLFRKSGRPLEAELAKMGYALQPAPPARYIFADGTDLVLPTDRGDQLTTLTHAYGLTAAARWRDLIDELDLVWQAVRPLGLESELREKSQLAPVRKLLQPRHSIEHLADRIGEPHLAAMIRCVAYRLGSTPSRTPAWCAVELSTARTFGRWMIQGEAVTETGRTSVLVDALAARLALRKVTVHLGSPVTGISATSGRATGVLTADGGVRAAAVICTADPWHTFTDLLPGRNDPRSARSLRRLSPALAPRLWHEIVDQPSTSTAETVALSTTGVPTISYTRPVGQVTLRSVHDFAQATPRPSAGLRWDGFASWLDRPAISHQIGGLFLAGPFSRGGNGASAVILSGGLASYACHEYLP